MNAERDIFKRASSTFFIGALFFPANIKNDVFELYSFVRVADDYVDQVPADNDGFYRLRQMWNKARKAEYFDTSKNNADSIDLCVVKNMLRVSRKNDFKLEWVESFLDSMQSDLTHKDYRRLDDTLDYISGSAEVVGLMMARIMNLPENAYASAKLQGRALQWINFIRDIDEDIHLGRQYFPLTDMERFNLPDLTRQTATLQPKDFTKFIQFQINRYEKWQAEAYAGYKYIPKRLQIPLRTAADMYAWTAGEIRKDPLVIFESKIKPSKSRAMKQALRNTLR